MRWLRAVVLLGFCAASAVPGVTRAASPGAVLEQVRESLLSAGSIQLKVMAFLARGDLAGAIALYETEVGETAPTWLVELQDAYAVHRQVAGQCQQVARTIYTAFMKLGQAPQYIAFRAKVADDEFMVFDLVNGRSAPVSRNSYHVAVRLGDLIYDAYTGPLGMRWEEYLSRLHAVHGLTWAQVASP